MKRQLGLFSVSMITATLAVGCGQAASDPFGQVGDAVKHAGGNGNDDKGNDDDEKGKDDQEKGKGKGKDHDAHKVTVCHIPPGNPDNAHTIEVDEAAVKAHLAHGDYLGACAEPDGSSSVSTGASGSTSGGGRDGSSSVTGGGGDGSSSVTSGGAGGAGGSRDDCREETSSTATTSGVGGAGGAGGGDVIENPNLE